MWKQNLCFSVSVRTTSESTSDRRSEPLSASLAVLTVLKCVFICRCCVWLQELIPELLSDVCKLRSCSDISDQYFEISDFPELNHRQQIFMTTSSSSSSSLVCSQTGIRPHGCKTQILILKCLCLFIHIGQSDASKLWWCLFSLSLHQHEHHDVFVHSSELQMKSYCDYCHYCDRRSVHTSASLCVSHFSPLCYLHCLPRPPPSSSLSSHCLLKVSHWHWTVCSPHNETSQLRSACLTLFFLLSWSGLNDVTV